jgi:hypothetical protein
MTTLGEMSITLQFAANQCDNSLPPPSDAGGTQLPSGASANSV